MKILITSGGTEEPIDGVRYITNFSSGRTGAGLAGFLAENGIDVVLLHGKHAERPEEPGYFSIGKGGGSGSIECVPYRTFHDLDRSLQKLLSNDTSISVVIHLAAVSDYSPVKVIIQDNDGEAVSREIGDVGKLSSSAETMSIVMKRNHKIINRIPGYAGDRSITLIGFKLTNTDSEVEREAAVNTLLENARFDLLVHNDLKNIDTGDMGGRHNAVLYHKNGSVYGKVETKVQLYRALLGYLSEDEHQPEAGGAE